MAAKDDWTPVREDDFAPVETRRAVAVTGGEKQAVSDEAKVAAERGVVPEGVKAFAYPAANVALFNIPSHIAATADYLTAPKGTEYGEVYKRQKEYEEALARRNPTESMAGTGAGIVGSIAVPLGPVATLGRGAAAGAARLGLGRFGQASASGATIGGASAGLSEAIEKAPSLIESPGETLKGVGTTAGLGTAVGAVLGPAAEKVATKFFAKQPDVLIPDPSRAGAQKLSPEAEKAVKQAFPDMTADDLRAMTQSFSAKFQDKGISADAAREAATEMFGIAPSKSMATGIKAPKAAAEAAEETTDIAREKLAGAAKSLFGTAPPPGATVDELFNNVKIAREMASRHYEITKATPGTFSEDIIQTINPTIYRTLEVRGFPSGTELKQYPQYGKAAEALKMIETGIGSGNYPLSQPLTIGNLDVVYKGINKLWRETTDEADRAALNAIREGFNNVIEKGIRNNLFSGNGEQLLADLKQSRILYQAYKNTVKGKDPAGKIVETAIQRMRGPDGKLLENLDPAAATAAAAIVNSRLIDPVLGPMVYKRLETILGSKSQGMETINKYIRAKAFDSSDDIEKLPESINNFFKNNPEIAKRVFTPAEIREARNLARAVQVATRRRITEEEREALLTAAARRVSGPIIGAISMTNTGMLGQIIGGIAGDIAMASPKAWTSIGKRRAEAAGAPITKPQISGRGVETPLLPYRVYPGVRDIGAFVPTETEPGYQLPPENVITVNPRPQRKAGGRVKTASQLIMAVEQAKRSVNNTTKPLMNVPDEHIARALEVANKHLED